MSMKNVYTDLPESKDSPSMFKRVWENQCRRKPGTRICSSPMTIQTCLSVTLKIQIHQKSCTSMKIVKIDKPYSQSVVQLFIDKPCSQSVVHLEPLWFIDKPYSQSVVHLEPL